MNPNLPEIESKKHEELKVIKLFFTKKEDGGISKIRMRGREK